MLLKWIEKATKRVILYDKPLTREQNLALLAATPGRLAGLTKGLSPARLLVPPEPGEWSAREVLAHLRASSAMGSKYIRLILNEDHPTTWIEQMSYRKQAFRPSLKAFTAQRSELLAPEAWSRTATVTGKPRQRTVRTCAQWLANHEGTHIRQIERIVNTLSIQP